MPRGRPKEFKFNDHQYVLSRIDKVGDCEIPGDDEPYLMWVSPQERGKSELDTIIHECLHAEFPDMEHDKVTQGAINIAELLWHVGFRKRGK